MWTFHTSCKIANSNQTELIWFITQPYTNWWYEFFVLAQYVNLSIKPRFSINLSEGSKVEHNLFCAFFVYCFCVLQIHGGDHDGYWFCSHREDANNTILKNTAAQNHPPHIFVRTKSLIHQIMRLWVISFVFVNSLTWKVNNVNTKSSTLWFQFLSH